MKTIPSCKLNNGSEMPYLGLGTWNLKRKTLEQAVNWAYNIGYRHFDTATLYKNENELGNSLKNLPRSDLFITTKVWPSDFGYKTTLKAIETSLNKLQMDYVDQYLIHWPRSKSEIDETWKALLKIYENGKSKSIGVSNFSKDQIEDLKDLGDIIPSTNQIRFSPWDYNQNILDYCKDEGIKIVAYSPLNEGRQLNDPKLKMIAEKYNMSPAQVCLRWNIEHDAITIPKSADKQRLLENSEIFEFKLDQSDVELLNSI